MTRYELLDRIGVGGMAEIFRGKAVAAGGFEKPVAIKRILPHLSQDKRFVELLIAEAKVLSLLKHRNIVQIFDVGLGDDGQYFLVMEYVDGKDLGRIQRGLETRRRRIPFDLALHVGAEICEALEHAHSARAPDGKPMSLVHRDVSPSNVLMSRAGEIKLTDFGIAKRAEQEATGHGAVRGKFAYISPEQARNEHLDPRSDVFSVGILLWELITSRRLFSGLGDLEALRAVREAKVPRLREIDGRLTSEVDALVMAALAPDRRSRPTAGQLAAKLRTIRYSLDVTVGDPATELAKIIDTAEEVERQSVRDVATPPARAEFEGTEATVIRIHTADEFSMRDEDAGMARARRVIDRFEEEETRQAQLSRDQMAFLRADARDSGELTSAVEPPLPGVPVRPVYDEPTGEPTRALLPSVELSGPGGAPDPHFEGDEATRLVAPLLRRTPPPERLAPPPERLAPRPRIATQPPPRPRPPTSDPLPHTPHPGTVHERRGPTQPPPSGSSAMAHPPPPLPPPPLPGMPPMLQPPQAPPRQRTQPPPGMQPMPQPPPAASPSMPMAQQAPPVGGSYGSWMTQPPSPGPMPQPMAMPQPMPIPPPMFDRPPSHRASLPKLPGARRARRAPLKPWALMLGALIMALLAFAVTRACIHTATRPAASTR